MSSILCQHPWLSQQNSDNLLKISNKSKEYELSEENIVSWFGNFSSEEEYELALKIFFLIDYRSNKRSIDSIKIYKNQIEQSMYQLNRKNIVLISSDKNTDSSNRFIYDIAKEWEILEINVFRQSQLENSVIKDKENFFIFFNDTHGTGNQFVKDFKNTVDSIGQGNCAIISITMTDVAIKRFNNEFPNIALIQPSFQSSKNIDKHQYDNKLNSKDIKLLKKLGEKVYSKGVLGYKDSALLIAYSHQCPNNTLPIIWANGINNEIENKAYPWKALFEYKKIKEIKKKVESNIIKKDIGIPIDRHLEKRLLTSNPPINPEFIGRVSELKKIKENLDSNNLIYIVNGIGGVGKSELSYQYFHQFSSDYKKTAFIELSSDLSLEEVFIIKFKDNFQVDNFEGIIKRLQEYPEKNLFLIDNLEKREDFKKIKVLNKNFDLLITTRLKDIDVNNQLELNTLLPKDAKKLFLKIFDEDENIEDILIYLDNHPLFINLMAKSLQRKYLSLDELRSNIKNNSISKINSKDSLTFKEHLHNTFNKQFENEHDNKLKTLLQKLAIFPSIEIKFEIFNKLLKVEKVQLQFLVDRGWLSQKDDEYKLHQIIRTFILEEHPLESLHLTQIFNTVAKFIDPNDSVLIANLLYNYIPIIESFLNLFEKKQDIYITGLYDSLTYLYFSLGQYDKSLEVQNESFFLKKILFTEKSENIANSFNLKAIIYREQGEYEKALPLYEKALKIREDIFGLEHPDTATSYNNLAIFYSGQGEYEKALLLYEKSLKIRENVLGLENFDTVTSYNNLASVYTAQGKHEKALPLYEKSLKIREDILGLEHPYTALGYNNLASLFVKQEEYEKALPLLEKSLKIREDILGQEHPDTANSYNNLAFFYSSQDKYENALPLNKKSLKIRENILGIEHPDTVSSYYNLGLLYLNMKYCSKAKEYLLKVKEIIEKNGSKKLSLLTLNRLLKKIEKNKKLEGKSKRNGRFCKEYKD